MKNTLFSVISQGSYLCFYTFIFLCIFSFHRTFHKIFIKNIIFSLFSIFLNLFLKIIFSFSFSQNYFFFLFQKNWTLFFCENSYFFIFYFFKIRQKTEHFAKPPFYFFLCIEKKFNSKHEKNLLLKNFENWFLSFFYVQFFSMHLLSINSMHKKWTSKKPLFWVWKLFFFLFFDKKSNSFKNPILLFFMHRKIF